MERVPSESDSNEDTSLPYNEQVHNFSDIESEEEVDSALETTTSIIRPTRLGRVRTLRGQMADFLQAGMTER